jgi:hypothetical protein
MANLLRGRLLHRTFHEICNMLDDSVVVIGLTDGNVPKSHEVRVCHGLVC